MPAINFPPGCGEVLFCNRGQPSQLDRIEAKIDRLIKPPEPDRPIVGTKEAMRLLGARSRSALYRQLTKLGVQPYDKGKYRRVDLTNAIGRRALSREKTQA